MEPIVVEICPPRLAAEAEEAVRAAVADGANGTEQVEKYIKEHTIRLGFVSATRRQSYKRGDAMQAAQKWLLGLTGAARLSDVDFEALDRDVFLTWVAAFQAADIIGSMVSHENWDPPERQEDWAEVPDYIFNPALTLAWELNPQWAAERAGASEGNS